MDVKAQTNVYVTECIRHFQSFAGVTLPQPVIIPVPISLASAQQNGYGAWATHNTFHLRIDTIYTSGTAFSREPKHVDTFCFMN